MSEELRSFLVGLIILGVVGLAIGIAIRKFWPESAKRYMKFSLNRQWKLFAFGALLFTIFGVYSFAQGRPHYGILFVILCCLELYCFFRYGFKSLSPEMEKRINASDPTRLLLIKFWKKQGKR